MDTLRTALDQLEKSERIGVLLHASPDIDTLASAEAIFGALHERGKVIGFITPPPPLPILTQSPFSYISAPQKLPRDFIISIDRSEAPISELRYEKGDAKLDIIITPKNSTIPHHAIAYQEGSVSCDCLIFLGISDPSSSPLNELGISPSFFNEHPIIAISTEIGGASAYQLPLPNESSSRAPVISIMDPSASSLSEIVWRLLCEAYPPVKTPNILTLLLAGIFCRTNNLRAHSITPGTLRAAADLLQHGARQGDAAQYTHPINDPSFLQLLGRALARSKKDADIVWSFITEQDFAKTGRSPDDAPALLRELAYSFPSESLHILLWEDAATRMVRAILVAPRQLLDIISTRVPSVLSNPHLDIQSRFPDFPSAEHYLESLLEEVR
jgi:nanoRNase/pAp phosphatase (c-di-AMP/oligoRNAs hydrolase)